MRLLNKHRFTVPGGIRKERLQTWHYSWILLRLAGFSCRSFQKKKIGKVTNYRYHEVLFTGIPNK